MEKTIKITALQARSMVEKYKGNQFFSVTFIKRSDGALRKMNCRKGVHKDVTGAGKKYNPADKDLVCVRDVKVQGFRSIPLENIVAISMTGNNFEVVKSRTFGEKE